MFKIFFILLCLIFDLFALNLSKNDAIDYLNTLRTKAGLSVLLQNQILEDAAQNHANYLSDVGIFGHYEDNIANPSKYYTGDTASQRGEYAGWRGAYYLENLSYKQNGVEASIDSLMSAIYHRYAFLNNNIDSIGIGIDESLIFNYNMANSLINELCFTDSYSGNSSSYSGVCSDSSFKVEKNLYNLTLNSLAQNSPNFIIWPPSDSIDIPTVFFEESPDPLPNHSVSGYPISIEFNDYMYLNSNISINSFKIYDEANNEITNTLLMDESNDPNLKHDKYQFSLFPLERLAWNHRYRVELDYKIDGLDNLKVWYFKTKDLGYSLYQLATGETLRIKSDITYALYFPPLDVDDIFNGVSSSCSASLSQLEIYDRNTILVSLSGSNGEYCNFDLTKNGTIVKNLKVQIANVADAPILRDTTSISNIIEDETIMENGDKINFYNNLIFIELDVDEINEMQVKLNINGANYILPSFDANSQISTKKLNGNVIIEVKTKLTKQITFKGR